MANKNIVLIDWYFKDTDSSGSKGESESLAPPLLFPKVTVLCKPQDQQAVPSLVKMAPTYTFSVEAARPTSSHSSGASSQSYLVWEHQAEEHSPTLTQESLSARGYSGQAGTTT